MEEGKLPHFDPDFEPQSRPRSCTWPLPRPGISPVKAEEADGSESAVGILPTEEPKQVTPQVLNQPDEAVISRVEGGVTTGVSGATPRKGSSRRNAWGNQSYADLISQAIETSPEQRLTLSQIYDWVVKTVPYFNDKGDSNSSAGWKNSIRHNLSLHNRFVRVHNEATGKSSWWMLNPEGGKSGRAASRHRAASLDNSGKLLKSRVRAKQAKKQQQQVATVGAASGLGGTGSVTLQGEGGVDAESSGPSQPLPKWGLNGNGSSPSSRGSLDDPDMWTGFRQRSSSNASTLSGRFSPAAPAPEDEDELPEDRLLGGFSAGGVPDTLAETLMEELDLIDGLTLITAQQQGGASSCSSAMAAPLVPRGASIPPLRSSQPSMSPQTSSQTGTGPPILQGASSSLNFSNSLFNSMPDAGSLVEDYRALLPSCLEFLLSSDTLPPLSDVMMSQVDPLMPGLGGTGLLGLSEGRGTSSQLSLEKDLEQNFTPPMTLLQHQQPKPQLGMGILPAALAQEAPTKVRLVPGLSNLIGGPHFDGGLPSTSENRGLHGTGQYGDPGFLPPCQDRLPTDLDIEMFTENLDCDVDYIINSDLMDGETYDFNFDPTVPPASQGYHDPGPSQGSSHNWVPS